jgi:lipoprotein
MKKRSLPGLIALIGCVLPFDKDFPDINNIFVL